MNDSIEKVVEDLRKNVDSMLRAHAVFYNKNIAMMFYDIAYRLTALSANEWLPIEIAPKDGSWIAAKRMGKRPFAIRYVNDCWQDENNLLRDPTHFYPLPEPKAAREFLGKVDG